MRLLTLVLFLLIPVGARADDPPFLIAAKERQAKAKAFVVKLSFVYSDQGREVIVPRGERKDFRLEGESEFMTDGGKWWYKADVPAVNATGIVFHKRKGAFDGSRTFLEVATQFQKGAKAGEWEFLRLISDGRNSANGLTTPEQFSSMWPFFFGIHSPLLDASTAGGSHWERVASSDRKIGDRLCHEYQRRKMKQSSPERLWVDEADQLPVRYERPSNVVSEMDYKRNEALGWVPSGWTETVGRPPELHVRHTRVTVNSFEMQARIPDEQFRLPFPAGSRVIEASGNKTIKHVVADDGTLTPVDAEQIPAEDETPAQPRTELPSPSRTMWVVGGTLAVFIAFVVLVKWLARSRADDPDRADDAR